MESFGCYMVANFKLLFRYLIPSISTNICVFLFGIIDGLFVGRGVGTNALGAVNIVWPFVMVSYAFNVLTSFGGTTLAAIAIGKKDYKEANVFFNISIYLTLIISVMLSLMGIFLTPQISILLGATSEYFTYVQYYLFWYSIFLIPNSVGVCLEHFCRNDNDPNLVLISTIISTILNIYLDYLLIFPIPLGVKGAAIATGISQTARLFIILIHYLRQKGILRINLIIPKLDLIKAILLQGSPEMIAQFASPVTILCMNLVLGRTLGTLGINAFAIICYIASFALSIMYGCSEGIQPLFGQSYGAKQYKRLRFFLLSGLVIAFLGSSICIIITIIFIRELCQLYNVDMETTDYIVQVLPQFSWGFILAGVNALISTFLYSIKRTVESVTFNILRSFIFNALCILGLPIIFGIGIIWYSYGISELLVLLVGLFFLNRVNLLRRDYSGELKT